MIPLDDGGLEGHALEPGHMERDVAGGGGEVSVIHIAINILNLISEANAGFRTSEAGIF